MATTCNFDKDNYENRKADKLLALTPYARDIGADTPVLRSVRHGAYLWDLSPRPRSGKSWRNLSSMN